MKKIDKLFLGLGCILMLYKVHAEPTIFKDADLALGRKLIAEHRCNQCHAQRVGGDGSRMYGVSGRITHPGLLRGMVEMCNTNLNMGLFPEEVTAISAVLNQEAYRFNED